MALQNLSIGVDDWLGASWLQSYYPAGLPEDWRYDYYLNEFRSALVAQTEWQAWTDTDLTELQALKRDGSGVYLRVDCAELIPSAQVEKVCQTLGDFVLGCLVFDQRWPDAQREWYGLPVTKVSRDQAWSGWQWRHGGWVLSGAPCGWVDGFPADAKQQAALLRDFVAALGEQSKQVGFFVSADAATAVQLQQLKTLAELLGY